MVAGWLRTLLTSRSQHRRRSAEWRLLYLNVAVDLADPCPKLQESVLVFKAWRARLHLVPLEGTGFLKVLYVQALQLGRAVADLADRWASNRFAKFLQEGPGKGIKHQHRLCRCAVGWIPAAVAELEPDEHLHDLDEADCPEVAEAARSQYNLKAPLSMQQSAEAERLRWAEECVGGGGGGKRRTL